MAKNITKRRAKHEALPEALQAGLDVSKAWIDCAIDGREGVVRLLPGVQGEHLGALHHPRRLQAGHHERGVALPGQHEHRQPLQRHRLVAGEPREVGTHREQQHVDAGVGHARSDPGDALGPGAGAGHRVATS